MLNEVGKHITVLNICMLNNYSKVLNEVGKHITVLNILKKTSPPAASYGTLGARGQQ